VRSCKVCFRLYRRIVIFHNFEQIDIVSRSEVPAVKAADAATLSSLFDRLGLLGDQTFLVSLAIPESHNESNFLSNSIARQWERGPLRPISLGASIVHDPLVSPRYTVKRRRVNDVKITVDLLIPSLSSTLPSDAVDVDPALSTPVIVGSPVALFLRCCPSPPKQ